MISLLQLEYFCVLAEVGHMSKAAEKLYISQSTLSTMITKLEKELGVSLFDRKNNRIYLNRCGETYYRHIKLALSEIDQANRDLQHTARTKLSISVSQEEVWQDFLLEFKRCNPECYLEQFTGIHSHFLELLLNGSADFVIAGQEALKHEKLERRVIAEWGICLAVPSSFPLAQRSSVSLSEIQKEPYIDLSQDAPFRCYSDALCEKAGIHLNRIMECDHTLRTQMVSSGQGVALIVDSDMTRKFYSNVSFLPVRDSFARRSICIYWLRGQELSPIMKKFLRFASEYFAEQ